MNHAYEELRSVVLDIIAGRERVEYPPEQFVSLVSGVAEVLSRQESTASQLRHNRPQLSDVDQDLVREIFWDLFLQRIITLGRDSSNCEYPWFKVSSQGKKLLDNQKPYIFHDVSSYTTLIRTNVPHLNDTTLLYLQEAMQSFRSGCLLAATVMLGVASEHSFALLLEAAANSSQYGPKFDKAAKQFSMLKKFEEFRKALDSHVQSDLPTDLKDGLAIQLNSILDVIRTFRNDAGHPTGKIMEREQVYVLLQMFVPYCKKLYGLIEFFKTA